MKEFYQQSFADLKVKREEHLLWITFNRPQGSNAFSIEMIEALVTLLKHADIDPEVRVILFTGEGKSFCAGGDIKAMEKKEGMFAGESNELRELYQKGIQQIPLTMEALKTPTIAVVNGAAIGAGCDFTAMCDLRIGSDKAKFGETFSKLALVPGDGGTYFLPRVVGYPKAMEMFLTGKIYSAQEALSFGLLNEMVDSSKLIETAGLLASKIANNAPVAIQMTKKAMKTNYLQGLQSALDLLSAYQGITQRSEDHFEGLRAFKEKRAPEFKGI